MNRRRKFLAVAVAAILTVAGFTGCGATDNSGNSGNTGSTGGTENTGNFNASKSIGVTSREDGSGTRGAFIELFGVEEKDENGNKIDHTTPSAVITNSTAVMMTTVSGDEYAIGYISLGSLNDTVKAVKIDGTEATVDNIKSDTYKIARPFNIVTGAETSEAAKDFVNFIMSADGQAVVQENNAIPVSDAPAYTGSIGAEKIVVSGSSSVSPVMEKLKEAYLVKNPDATIEIQTSDSTSGVTDTIDGSCDIGMASRELKDTELAQGVTGTVIAMDGIAVIVNNDNPVDNLTSAQVKDIFTGNAAAWDAVIGQ